MFEDSSRNLISHDAVDTGVGAPVSDGDGRGAHGFSPGERGVPVRILGKDRSLADRATPWLQDDPLGGHRLAQANLYGDCDDPFGPPPASVQPRRPTGS